jgi:hypothetical protein
MGLSRISMGLLAIFVAGNVLDAEQPAKPKPPIVVMAVAALQKEYQAHVKEPKKNSIRSKSDYFKQNPSPDATPEAILKALEGSVSGGYPADAYVKWQLLSGLPGKFPEELVKRAVAVYRRAPAPANHPGVDHRAMNRAIMGVQKDRISAVQKEFDAAVADVDRMNHIVLEYRDDLYSHLPQTFEVLSAGLADAGERALCGLNANGFFDNVSGGIRSWVLAKAKPDQVRNLASEAVQVKNAVEKDASKPYNKLVDENGVKWKSAGAMIDGKKLDELIKFLQANEAASGGGGLKFKDDK